MRYYRLLTVLVGVLLASSLLTALLAARYFFTARSLHQMQGELAVMNQKHRWVNALMDEALVYAKQHPEIEPVLQPYLTRPKGTNAPVSNSAARPTVVPAPRPLQSPKP